ncbi:hypothetical protein DAEQUDRAFT_721579 [Daedalea quercina L-15889]|uniref:Uncharacterized protein n=1 Tax=Daedalea quercina L-15889 TaxID=1314783 RepID=A0A165TJ74_9APHY|nr:hypothetical protein DAEQUDRAFT_721579 [Daedalea quercina L-15889]
MSTNQRSLLFLLLSASHLYVLAAPAGPGVSASVITETLIEIPSTIAASPAKTAVDSETRASSTPAATDVASRVADGSLTLVPTTETILFIPSTTGAPSASGLSSSAVFAQDVLSTSSPQPVPTSDAGVADLQAASGTGGAPTTLYVPPLTTTSYTPIQAAETAAATTLFVSSSSVTQTSSGSSVTHTSVQHSTTVPVSFPNPTSETEVASSWKTQQSRHSAILAAFLIIGVLSMFGITYGCMRFNLPTRLGYARRRRDSKKVRFADVEEVAAVNTPYPASASEKDSIAPDSAVFAYQEVTVPSLARQPNGPASNGPRADWRILANYDGQFEDVTHILSTGVFAPLDRHARTGSRGSMSVLSGSRDSSPRTSGGGASFTGDSYKSCESRYSVPSVGRQSAGASPASAPLSGVPELEAELVVPNSPPSPALPVTPGCVHSEPGVPLGCVGNKEPHELVRALRESAVSAESEWDVAKAYGAHSSIGGDSLLSRVESVVFEGPMESVDVGGKKCVLVQG